MRYLFVGFLMALCACGAVTTSTPLPTPTPTPLPTPTPTPAPVPFPLTLTWDKSASPEVTGYRIYWGIGTNADYANVVDTSSNLQVTIQNFQPGVQYQFAATAYDAVGDESDFSMPAYWPPLTTNKTSKLRFNLKVLP